MPALSDEELRALIRRDPERGWRAFIDQYTPLLVGLIRRAGVVDRDEQMEIYVLMCEQLSAGGYQRLKSQDAARGSLGGWLAVLIRHAIVDWVRSRKGRRRLFGVVEDLEPFDRFVFESFYWNGWSLSEIVELLPQQTGERTDLTSVMEAIQRVQSVLSDRHRAELLALAARSRAAVPIDETDAADRVVDPQGDPDVALRIRRLNAGLETALAALPAEDASIVRLKYVEGLSNADVARALGIEGLTPPRVREILARLREALVSAGVSGSDAALGGHVSLDRSPSS